MAAVMERQGLKEQFVLVGHVEADPHWADFIARIGAAEQTGAKA